MCSEVTPIKNNKIPNFEKGGFLIKNIIKSYQMQIYTKKKSTTKIITKVSGPKLTYLRTKGAKLHFTPFFFLNPKLLQR